MTANTAAELLIDIDTGDAAAVAADADTAVATADADADADAPVAAAGSDRISTLSSELVKRLRQSILNGELRPGSKLKLEALRERLGMTLSRSPLREALSRLGAEGLVVIEDQRGYRVAPISEKNLREIAKLRVTLETLALRESIEHGDRKWEAGLRQALTELAAVPRTDGMSTVKHEAWEVAHRSFHLAVLGGCDMPMLLAHCSAIHDQNDRYRRLFLADHPFDRDVKGEHAAIVEAALERNADLACALLARHVHRTIHNISAAITEAGAATPQPFSTSPRQ